MNKQWRKTPEPGALLDVQGLLEELVQVEQERRIVDDQGGAGLPGLLVGGNVLLAGEGHDRDMAGHGMAAQPGDFRADGFKAGFEVNEGEHGHFAFRGGQQVGGARHGLHAVTEILQAVDQLATGQEFLVEQQR